MSFAVRVRSVRFHNGGQVRLLPRAPDRGRADVETSVRRILDAHTAGLDIAGFAFVVWDAEGSSACDMQCMGKGSIPTMLAPDFVKNRLMAYRIETWTREGLGY